MYAIYAYIGVVWGANVGIYGIHGASGLETQKSSLRDSQEVTSTDDPGADGATCRRWILSGHFLRVYQIMSRSAASYPCFWCFLIHCWVS